MARPRRQRPTVCRRKETDGQALGGGGVRKGEGERAWFTLHRIKDNVLSQVGWGVAGWFLPVFVSCFGVLVPLMAERGGYEPYVL